MSSRNINETPLFHFIYKLFEIIQMRWLGRYRMNDFSFVLTQGIRDKLATAFKLEETKSLVDRTSCLSFTRHFLLLFPYLFISHWFTKKKKKLEEKSMWIGSWLHRDQLCIQCDSKKSIPIVVKSRSWEWNQSQTSRLWPELYTNIQPTNYQFK